MKLLLISVCFLLSCSAMRNRSLWVRSHYFKVISVKEGHIGGETVWFIEYETSDGIRCYERTHEYPNLVPGDLTRAFLIR